MTVFTDLNAYTAATTNTTLIGFNGILPVGTKFENINPLIVSGVEFSSSSSFDVTTADYYAPRNYAADFLMSVDSSGGAATLNITFPLPTYAAALDYGQIPGGSPATITLSNGFTFSSAALPATGTTAFFGFTSLIPITRLSYTVTAEAWVIVYVRLSTPNSIGALPTISMSLSSSIIPAGQSATLTWSSTNAVSCNASNSWSGPQATSGTLVVTPAAPGYYAYVLTCTGATYTSLQSVVLTAYGSTPVAETLMSPPWYHTSYYTVLGVPTPNQIVALQTSMTVPPLPPVPTDPRAVLYLWPGLNPTNGSVNLMPINIGLLQPVLTWGTDQNCVPLSQEPPAFSSWWISALYVNTAVPGYAVCFSGDSMLVTPGDVLLMSMTLNPATGVWAQTVVVSATKQTVASDINLEGQGQNVATFAIEVNYGSTIHTPVVFSNTVITFQSPDFSASCSSGQGTRNAFTLTPPVLNSAGTQCSIATIVLTQPTAVPVPAGVINAASFAKDASGAGSAVAPGSLIQVYSSLDGATQASAQTASFPLSLGGVSVTFDDIPAPIQAVTPSAPYPSFNAQLPFEITDSSTTMVVTVNGVPSAPVTVAVTPQAPGVFTSPPDGQHNAIFVYIEPASGTAKIAAPTSDATNFTIPTAPIPRGTNGFFYATGLGSLMPSLADGAAPSLTDTTVYEALMMPTVLVGGVAAPVAFAGQAPGYPGVNQINITIPANAPTGSSVPLQLMSADGKVLSTPGATIAIQ